MKYCKVGFIGECNSGKSALINRLLGVVVLDTDPIPTENEVYSFEFSYSPSEKIEDFGTFKVIKVTAPFKGLKKLNYVAKILEAPGLGRSFQTSIVDWEDPATDYVVENSDIVLVVIEATSGGIKYTIFQYVKNKLEKPFYVVINKIDLLNVKKVEFEEMIKQIREKFRNFSNFRGIITTSALSGNIRELKNILRKSP